jgi:transcriptional regulator with XRE-family HTH domain
MHFKVNIKFLRNRKNRTQEDVASALGMKRSTLSGYENGVAQPNIAAIILFSKYFNISIDTLLKIDLAKFSEFQLSELEQGYDVFITGTKLRVLATSVDKNNEENIELVPEKAKAGYANGFADPEYIKELPVFQLPFLSKQKKFRTFQLSGDSMLPIPHGSWVTVEFIQDWNSIVNGHAYIVVTLDDGVVFKIAENLIKTENKLSLYSLNPAYQRYDVHVAQIKEIWQFVHFISSELPDPIEPKDELFRAMESIRKDVAMIKKKVAKK